MTMANILVGAGVQPITVRTIGLTDLNIALRRGLDDFLAMPTHAFFLALIYPIIGLVLARLAFGYSVLPLIYPLASGFALVGPVAALGLYELSRQREEGREPSVMEAFDVIHSSSIGAIFALGCLFVLIFGVWLAVANGIYISAFGYGSPASLAAFVHDIVATPAGWYLVIVGNFVGFCFAALALSVGVISFPMLLDRDVGAAVALSTSLRAVAHNPLTMAIWGVIVAVLLLIGSIPCFLGLTIVLPVLGHATWHLYRRTVDAGGAPHPVVRPIEMRTGTGADFPVNVLPWKR
jgi:uncharacterized membrane protein